jgi:hypothetical protein
MDSADEIWNRAIDGGGPNPCPGDLALFALLRLHTLAMSGGLLEASERLGADKLDAAQAGYQWMGLGAAADVLTEVRREIAAGVLDDDDRAERLELSADEDYAAVVPTDQTLVAAFKVRLGEQPEAFASLDLPHAPLTIGGLGGPPGVIA